MKKIVLILFSVGLFLTSCSEESIRTSESVNQTSAKRHVDLLSLYKKMESSSDYKKLLKSINNFNDKLHFDGSIVLEKEEDLLKWGHDNINTTEFTDYTEFLSDWSAIINIQEMVITQNDEFYSGIVENYPDIDFTSSLEYFETNVDCPCHSQGNECYHAADISRNMSIYAAMLVEALGGADRKYGISLAVTVHNMNIRSCNEAYNLCLSQNPDCN